MVRTRNVGLWTPEINIELLKRHTEYSGMGKDDPRIALFWKCLESYSNEERRRFIKFAWGQKRIPSSDREWSEKGARFFKGVHQVWQP